MKYPTLFNERTGLKGKADTMGRLTEIIIVFVLLLRGVFLKLVHLKVSKCRDDNF